MSSNEPIHTILEDDTTNVLNQAIKTHDLKRIQTLTSTKTLDASLLIETWQQYKQARLNLYKKNQIFLTLFDPCHYSGQQRLTLVNFAGEYVLQHGDDTLARKLLKHLSPIDDILPLTRHLIQNRFLNLCQAPFILSQLLQSLPEDQWYTPCRDIMTQLRQMPETKQHAKALFNYAARFEPLSKALFCLLSEIPDPELASLSDDWQTVFTKFCAGGQRSLLLLVEKYGLYVMTEKNLVSLLTLCQEDQRLNLLQALHRETSSFFNYHGKNGELLQNVLTLLPRPQRGKWLLNNPFFTCVCDDVSDELWPIIAPLVDSSTMAAILRHQLIDAPSITHLISTIPGEELWPIWKHLSQNQVYHLSGIPKRLMPLLNQLPAEAQPSARQQLLTNLATNDDRVTHTSLWLKKEPYFATLFPVANQWLNEAADTQNLSFNERFPVLATRPTALHAFLDTLPDSERNAMLPWLVSTHIQDADILNGLMSQYTDERYLLSGKWTYWTEKMPLVLTILERLSPGGRLTFIQQLPKRHAPWKPDNYPIVHRAYTLFGQSVETFRARVGLDGNIPCTPLVQAVRDNNKKMAQEHSHSINEQDQYGQTALMHACFTRNADMAWLLARQPDCDVSLKTLSGATVFAFATMIQDTFFLHHLLGKSHGELTLRDATTALSNTHAAPGLAEFLFETYFPKVSWQQPPHSDLNWYQKFGMFREYYAKASLPVALADNTLSELMLDLDSHGIFRYQMRTLGIDPTKALNLEYLLQALTGRVSKTLCFVGFHIDAHDIPCLVDFVKNNPHLKQLSLGTLYWYPEDEQTFIDQLNRLQGGRIELAIHGRDKTYITLSKPTIRGGFFESPVQDVEERASSSFVCR